MTERNQLSFFKFTSNGEIRYYSVDPETGKCTRVSKKKAPPETVERNIHQWFYDEYEQKENALVVQKEYHMKAIAAIEEEISTLPKKRELEISYEVQLQNLNKKKYEETNKTSLPERDNTVVQKPINEPKTNSQEYPEAFVKVEDIRRYGRNSDKTDDKTGDKAGFFTETSSFFNETPSEVKLPSYFTFGHTSSFFGEAVPEPVTQEQEFLASMGITDKSSWRQWNLENHPDKNPDADIDLVSKVNSCYTKCKELFSEKK